MWHLNWGQRYENEEAAEVPRRRRRAETKSQHRTKEQTQVMYKLTSDTMDGVCAS